MNRLMKKKHGFTLVELIVVLVILAILLAILIPALTGWIDKSREKQVFINGRTAYLAVQTLEDEAYGRKNDYAEHDGPDNNYVKDADVKKLADLADGSYTSLSWHVAATAKITAFSYVEKGYTVSIADDGGLQVKKNP